MHPEMKALVAQHTEFKKVFGIDDELTKEAGRWCSEFQKRCGHNYPWKIVKNYKYDMMCTNCNQGVSKVAPATYK